MEPADDVVTAVSDVCGVQAQVPAAAELAISARVPTTTRAEVQAELWERRRLVKTWLHRGTLHLVPAAELPLWTAALSAAPGADDVPAARVDEVVAAIGDALAGRCLTREELADEVAARVGRWADERLRSGWGYFLGDAARAGLLCFGPDRGRNVTFVRADEWIGGWEAHEPHAALAEVVRRSLHAYGPSTPRDMARWLGVEPAATQRAFDDLGGEVEPVSVGRRRAWLLAADAQVDWPPPEGVNLLARYDCYVLGSYPREQIVPKHVAARLREHPRGRFEVAAGHWTLLVDGVVAGMWERREREGGITVRVEAFVELSPAQRGRLEQEAARVGAFLGVDAALELGTLA